MKIKTYTQMDYDELDKMVQEHIGVKYESVAENEWNNDSSYTFSVKREPLDKWDKKTLEVFRAGNREGNLWAHIVLQELVNLNILPEGDFLVEVSW